MFKQFFEKNNQNKKNLEAINNDIPSEQIPKILSNFIGESKKEHLGNLYKDLEIFHDRDGNKENSVFSKINNCQTHVGENHLQQMISNYSPNRGRLEIQQQLIKDLINKPEDCRHITQLLDSISKSEIDILWLWKDHTKETKSYLDMVYFKGFFLESLNKNELFLKFFNLFQIVVSPAMNIITPIICVIIPYLLVRFTTSMPIDFKEYFRALNLSESLGPDGKSLKYAQYMSVFIWILYYAHSVYSSVKVSMNTNKIINIIHSRVNNIANFIKKSFEINEKYCHYFGCDQLSKVCNDLWCQTFVSSPNLFSDKGKILVTYRNLISNKDILKPVINFLGKVDSYLSIIKLYQNNQASKNKFCFPKYHTNSRPFYQVEGLWHPYLDKEKSVNNNFDLGEKTKNNAIITGPNAGGKSTFIKSVVISILLSQTLGVCPGQRLSLTLFSTLETYLNIPDVKGKESLFEAEVNRALSYVKSLSEMPEDNYSLIVMDEIFNSTNPEEGIAGAYSICQKLSNFTNNLSIITTHFNYLTNLAKDTSKFVNYKIPIEKDNNKIIYPYKIIEGVSRQFIAIELLREKGFDQEIIENALKICKRLQTKNKKKKKIIKNTKLKIILIIYYIFNLFSD